MSKSLTEILDTLLEEIETDATEDKDPETESAESIADDAEDSLEKDEIADEEDVDGVVVEELEVDATEDKDPETESAESIADDAEDSLEADEIADEEDVDGIVVEELEIDATEDKKVDESDADATAKEVEAKAEEEQADSAEDVSEVVVEELEVDATEDKDPEESDADATTKELEKAQDEDELEKAEDVGEVVVEATMETDPEAEKAEDKNGEVPEKADAEPTEDEESDEEELEKEDDSEDEKKDEDEDKSDDEKKDDDVCPKCGKKPCECEDSDDKEEINESELFNLINKLNESIESLREEDATVEKDPEESDADATTKELEKAQEEDELEKAEDVGEVVVEDLLLYDDEEVDEFLESLCEKSPELGFFIAEAFESYIENDDEEMLNEILTPTERNYANMQGGINRRKWKAEHADSLAKAKENAIDPTMKWKAAKASAKLSGVKSDAYYKAKAAYKHAKAKVKAEKGDNWLVARHKARVAAADAKNQTKLDIFNAKQAEERNKVKAELTGNKPETISKTASGKIIPSSGNGGQSQSAPKKEATPAPVQKPSKEPEKAPTLEESTVFVEAKAALGKGENSSLVNLKTQKQTLEKSLNKETEAGFKPQFDKMSPEQQQSLRDWAQQNPKLAKSTGYGFLLKEEMDAPDVAKAKATEDREPKAENPAVENDDVYCDHCHKSVEDVVGIVIEAATNCKLTGAATKSRIIEEAKRLLEAEEVDFYKKQYHVDADITAHSPKEYEENVEDAEKDKIKDAVKLEKVNESVSYSSIKEACLLDEDYFVTDSYKKETAEAKQAKLTEQVSILLARENMDPLYEELLKESIHCMRLQEAIEKKYANEAAKRASLIYNKQ